MPRSSPRVLLLSPELGAHAVTDILRPYGFRDCARADANLQALADDPLARQRLADLVEAVLDEAADSADPDQALDYLERFAKASSSKVALFSSLHDSPAMLHLLMTVFGSSPFLSQSLIRNPEYLYWAARPEVLDRCRSRRVLEKDLRATLGSLRSQARQLDALRRFKRRELLAIGIRDLLGKASVRETTAALSHLADVLIQQAYAVCREGLAQAYGYARTGFTVLGMGKLGGEELNFSSDVDLVYLCGSDAGTTTGTKSGGKTSRLPRAEYFRHLAQDVTNALSAVTNEGYLFRVDLRLRPEGKAGAIVGSLKEYGRYYQGWRGQPWERLALIKARPVAGDKALGKSFLKVIRTFVYRKAQPRAILAEVMRIKRLIDQKMVAREESERNVKLGRGGIREVELAVQTLQAMFGAAMPVQERNTEKALGKLFRARLIGPGEHRFLLDGYWFLRNVEHKLQMVEEQQTHTLSADPVELHVCALRLGYKDAEEAQAEELFRRDYARHAERIHDIFVRVLAGEIRPRRTRPVGVRALM